MHLIRHRLDRRVCVTRRPRASCAKALPVGFVYDEEDRVLLDPNEAVIEAIATVFRRFDESGSARQVMLSLVEDNVLIPRRPSGSRRVRGRRRPTRRSMTS